MAKTNAIEVPEAVGLRRAQQGDGAVGAVRRAGSDVLAGRRANRGLRNSPGRD